MSTLSLSDKVIETERKSKHLEVILKVAERCNINCRYCYVFNKNDTSYKDRPPYISPIVIEAVTGFLLQGAIDLGIKDIQIDFHGGEPLLLNKNAFEDMCLCFRSVLEPMVNLNLCIQTNAIPVDEEWISIFERNKISVGASIDGPAEYNDQQRVDFRNRGTYDRAAQGIKLLKEAYDMKRIESFGILCVIIDPKRSARKIYRHFVDNLGITAMDFLLPDTTYDEFDFETQDPEEYGHFLCDLFDTWTEDDNPDIQVRVLNSVLSLMLGGKSVVTGYGQERSWAITIASNGQIGPDDVLRGCDPDLVNLDSNVANTTLKDFFESPFIKDLDAVWDDVCETCLSCCWLKVCGGGAHIVNRYKKGEGFKNPSVLCQGLKNFYSHVAAYLVREGVSFEHLQKAILGSSF